MPEPGFDPTVRVLIHCTQLLPDTLGKQSWGHLRLHGKGHRGSREAQRKREELLRGEWGQRGFGLPGRGTGMCLELGEHVGERRDLRLGHWAGVDHREPHGPDWGGWIFIQCR